MSGALRILNETRIDVDEVWWRMGPEGKPLHYTSVYRAFNPGWTAPDGGRVTLEHLRTGGRLITSVEAVERYMARAERHRPGLARGRRGSPWRSKARQRELASGFMPSCRPVGHRLRKGEGPAPVKSGGPRNDQVVLHELYSRRSTWVNRCSTLGNQGPTMSRHVLHMRFPGCDTVAGDGVHHDLGV